MTDALRGVDDEGLPVIPPPRVRGDHTRGLAGLAGLGVGLSVGRKVLMLV